MTRKHFIMLAELVRDLPDGTREDFARKMADQLCYTNPGFNRSRFLAACNVEAR